MANMYSRLVLVLAALLIAAGTCIPARARSERLSDHFTVWFDGGSRSSPLPVSLVYSREGGILADGILHFMPLKDFLMHYYEAPVAVIGSQPVYHVDYDASYFDGFSAGVSYYEPTEDGFVRIRRDDRKAVELEDLRPGDYLMAVDIHAEKGEEYYAGAAFIHIIIPGADRSVWPIPAKETPTPTRPPAPTPSQVPPSDT